MFIGLFIMSVPLWHYSQDYSSTELLYSTVIHFSLILFIRCLSSRSFLLSHLY
ncbi:hypothetical protein BGY98DRAFT_1002513 [Russula aff. rugulosa BPL654]|nr:hypothetical protein BGY98DRAFT_1002513 [Russula aff. rugulosa BPL654]